MSLIRVFSSASAALLLIACSPVTQHETVVHYRCGALALSSQLVDDKLLLSFGEKGSQTLQLSPAHSTSGARYTDVVSGAEFWRKGNEAQFSSDDFSLPLCVERGTLPQQFNARGNEPFWFAAIDTTNVVLRQPGVEEKFVINRPVGYDAETRTYHLEFAEGVELVLTEQVCYDSMSGQSFPLTADLHRQEQMMTGCAGDPNRLLAGASWQLLSPASELGSAPYMSFHSDERVSGFAGCNYFNGRYQITGEGIEFGPMAVTKRMCVPDLMRDEDNFLRHLQGTTNVKVFSDDTLQLQQANGDYLQFQQVALKLWSND